MIIKLTREQFEEALSERFDNANESVILAQIAKVFIRQGCISAKVMYELAAHIKVKEEALWDTDNKGVGK